MFGLFNKNKKNLNKLILDYGQNTVCKAFAAYIIEPYWLELKKNKSIFVEFAAEKFLRDQFDAMYDEAAVSSSKNLRKFYNSVLEKTYYKYKGALEETAGFGIDEFNDNPNGPSQRIMRINYAMQRVTSDIELSVDVTVEAIEYIYNYYLQGLFLPVEKNPLDDNLLHQYIPSGNSIHHFCYELSDCKYDDTKYTGKYIGPDYELVTRTGSIITSKQEFLKNIPHLQPILHSLNEILFFA